MFDSKLSGYDSFFNTAVIFYEDYYKEIGIFYLFYFFKVVFNLINILFFQMKGRSISMNQNQWKKNE